MACSQNHQSQFLTLPKLQLLVLCWNLPGAVWGTHRRPAQALVGKDLKKRQKRWQRRSNSYWCNHLKSTYTQLVSKQVSVYNHGREFKLFQVPVIHQQSLQEPLRKSAFVISTRQVQAESSQIHPGVYSKYYWYSSKSLSCPDRDQLVRQVKAYSNPRTAEPALLTSIDRI